MAIAIAENLELKEENIKISSEVLEIIDYLVEKYINNGLKIPYTNSKEKLEDGRYLGEWLNYYRMVIKKLAKEGNENAKLIVEQFKWNVDSLGKTKEIAKKRIHYIYEEYIMKGKPLPSAKSSDVFPDANVSIANWFRLPRIKEVIKILVNEGDKETLAFYELIKWDLFYTKEEQSIERIKYIYETYITKNISIPDVKSTDLFEDSIKIGNWIKDNKDTILTLSKKGNEHAKKIVEILMLDKSIEEKYKERTLVLLKERLQFLYEKYILNGNELPKYNSDDTFEDGTPIYKWINRKSNKENIEMLANEGDTVALEIMKYITWGQKALIKLSQVNVNALEICLTNRWILEKEASNYPTYNTLVEKRK